VSFQDKNVLVVGGSSGIGKEVLATLLSEGANVWNLSRSSPSIRDVKHIGLDISEDFVDLPSLPDSLHGLVYCPGTINLKPFTGIKIEDFQHDLEINVFGLIKILRATIKQLRKAKGSVVAFSTVAVDQGMSFHSSIALSKGAVEGLMRSLAAEYAKASIRFNVVAPSLTNTPLAENLISTDEKLRASAERHPLKRIGNPTDIAAAAYYLLSENSSWMTGQILRVDGGMSSLKLL
jgi:3-oxoacyl-[acyl-carrier protein] reductase